MKDKRINLVMVASAASMALTPRQIDLEEIPGMLDLMDDFMVVSSADLNAPKVIEAHPVETVPVSLAPARPKNKPQWRDHDYRGNHPMRRR